MIVESADAAFHDLMTKISRDRGFGCASYKEKCLRRRIAVRMRARGVHSYGDYARLLDSDGGEYERLLDALTINVTKLFRNGDVFAALADHVVPSLWACAPNPIRIWSAGCSSGEEAYSLAVLFHHHAATTKALAYIECVDVLGTDIDRGSLAAAQRGEFEEGAFADTPAELRQGYFTDAAPFTVAPAIKQMVRFERRDLLVEPAPSADNHLIACRNVLIYFDRDTQERLFEKFYHALRPGGVLVLGKVETLLGQMRSKFVPVDARQRIFRRL